MLIQAAADFHGKESRYGAFLLGLRDNSPDIAVLAGDIDANPLFFKFLGDIDVPTLVIHGNVDGIDIGKKVEKYNAFFIHEKMYSTDGINFIGAGGINPMLNDIYSINKKEWISLKDVKMDVLVTHVPPKGVMDKMGLGLHIGNRWVRNITEEKRPRLIICGHVHENPGYTHFGETTVVNCTIGRRGRYSLIEMNDKIKIDIAD
ncbi:MAG: metallophosphoesterase family protein [Candidatus Thermoplasmatota archaeon]|nr:metallophosphoesterase family protein [Candidatus Thermoplasmatota archaeon]